jgi:hypothetical protein
LHSVGIIETILKSLKTVGAMSDTIFDGRGLILEGIHDVLVKIALKSILTNSGNQV